MRFFTVVCCVIAITGCAIGPQYENNYTAENRYKKEVKNFPFIQIASTHVPDSVIERKDITYVDYGKRELQLDLYMPRDLVEGDRDAKTAGVILVHGGGWRSGYRTHLTPLAIELAKAGYVTATISYRLAPEAEYPAAIHDVKAAVRWLRSNADTYHVDGDRIAVGGSSAGGQIASLTGVTNGLGRFDPMAQQSPVSSDVQAILNIDGLSDFTSVEARKHEDDPSKDPSSAGLWFGGRYAEKTELWHDASPIYYVHENTPPILFLNSSIERFHVGRDEMIEKLEAHGISYRVETLPNTPHTFWLFDPWLAPASDIVIEFLDRHLKP